MSDGSYFSVQEGTSPAENGEGQWIEKFKDGRDQRKLRKSSEMTADTKDCVRQKHVPQGDVANYSRFIAVSRPLDV